jgi:hypothetical protein
MRKTPLQLTVSQLLERYPVSPEQRRIIIDASTKPPKYQKWFYDQFTRNR